MINSASYPISSLERQPVILGLMASAAFGKLKSNQDILSSNFTFYNLSTGGFVINCPRMNFFLENTREGLE